MSEEGRPGGGLRVGVGDWGEGEESEVCMHTDIKREERAECRGGVASQGKHNAQ